MSQRYRNSPTKHAPFLTRTRLLIFLGAVVVAGIVLGLSLFRARQTLAAHYDTLILNGRIIDGTGQPARAGAVGIREGRVVEVEWASFATADRIIDAEGMVVAPGFIDVHTHIERNVDTLAGPLAAENFLTQGFTTLVTGNCGRSAQSLAQFFSRLESAGTAVNVASLVGHNTVRRQVLGESPRAGGADEIARMKSLVARAMDEGALGFSTGLEYEPGMFAPRSEIEALAGVAGERGGLYATHMRDEGNGVEDSLREAIEVARKSGAPLEISHLKARGRTNWGSAKSLVEMVRAAQGEGLRITFDAYPYTASSTTIDLLLPKEAREGDAATHRARMRNPAARARIVEGVLAQMRGEGWQDFSFARVAYFHFDQSLNGLTIPEVAARLGASRLNEIPSPAAPIASSSSDPAVVSTAEDEGAPPAPAQTPPTKTDAQPTDEKNPAAPPKSESEPKGEAGKPATTETPKPAVTSTP
ncbi:MAG TPA: amidohydrolase family protein, partial [Pyrinomonadaceae bacterium]|nr:amidohydrolase family protein [Pyrinomonadaceae bacterium]